MCEARILGRGPGLDIHKTLSFNEIIKKVNVIEKSPRDLAQEQQ